MLINFTTELDIIKQNIKRKAEIFQKMKTSSQDKRKLFKRFQTSTIELPQLQKNQNSAKKLERTNSEAKRQLFKRKAMSITDAFFLNNNEPNKR